MTPQGFAREVAGEAIKATPPVAVTGATLLGLSLQEAAQLIVFGLTAIYIILQCGYLLWRWRRDRRNAAGA